MSAPRANSSERGSVTRSTWLAIGLKISHRPNSIPSLPSLRSFTLILFSLSAFTFSTHAGDWPQWLGPQRDCHASTNSVTIQKIASEPKVLWRKKIGGGFSSPVAAAGRVVYFDEDGTNEVVHLLNEDDGGTVWSTPIGDVYRDEWSAGPRSTPIMDADRVYVQSCKGEFRCLNWVRGEVLWGFSFENDFGVKFLGSKAKEGTAARRGNNGTSVVSGALVIVPVGSTNGATLVARQKLTGKIVWQCGEDEAAYSSPVVATLDGVKQVVYMTADALLGVAWQSGKILWRVPFKTDAKRHAMTPVIYGDTVIINSHTLGLVSTKISKNGATTNWVNKQLKINLSTPVLVGDYLYSQGPNKNFICADARTGELKWQAPGFGEQNSSTICVGTNLLVLTDGGQLVLVAARPDKYMELGRAQVCGKNWNFPAYVDGKLYVRDARELICYDLLK